MAAAVGRIAAPYQQVNERYELEVPTHSAPTNVGQPQSEHVYRKFPYDPD